MEKNLSSYPVIIEQSVTWGDMDANYHVNSVVYFRYMENACFEYYNRIGKDTLEERTGVRLIMKSVHCSYLYPLAYPDRISIGARVQKIAPDHIVMAYIVTTIPEGRVAATGEATIEAQKVADNTKFPIPDAFKNRILDLQQGGLSPVVDTV